MKEVHAAGGQLDAMQAQLLPVLFVQKSGAALHCREDMVVGSHQKQALHPAAVVAGDLGHLHLIQSSRDRPHIVLGQHQLQQPDKFLCIQGHVLENVRELIRHLAQQLPQLAVLHCPLKLAQLLQPRRPLLQLPRQLQLLQKRPQHPQLASGGLLRLHACSETAQRAGNPAAQGVDLR